MTLAEADRARAFMERGCGYCAGEAALFDVKLIALRYFVALRQAEVADNVDDHDRREFALLTRQRRSPG
jgi:hypothetical protein